MERIEQLNPVQVQFETKIPEAVKCTITLEGMIGRGVAICSVIDESVFSERKGKNIAAGRAVKALINQTSDEIIRCSNFPNTWWVGQTKRLVKYYQEEGFKSQFGRLC